MFSFQFWQYFYIFGTLWILQFISDSQQFIVAAAISTWFFTRDKTKITHNLILQGVKNFFLYHMGTVAMGSFIIAIFQVFKFSIGSIERQLNGKENRVAKFILKMLMCCIFCFQKLLVYVNRNIYIMAGTKP